MSLVLRPLRGTDRDRLLRWRNDPEVAQWMTDGRPIPAETHDRWLAKVLAVHAGPEPDRMHWVVEEGERPLGVVNLARIDWDRRQADWGYYLADPGARGRGIGAAAQTAVLAHAFGPLNLRRVRSEVLSHNAASLALLMAAGFRREGVLRDHVRRGDLHLDLITLGLSASDWASVQPRLEADSIARGRSPAQLIAI